MLGATQRQGQALDLCCPIASLSRLQLQAQDAQEIIAASSWTQVNEGAGVCG